MPMRIVGCIALLLMTLCPMSAWAQNDLSTTAIVQPVSGCALSANENVTIRLFNFGNTLPAGTSFNVSYLINSGVPVNEMVVLGSSLLSNSAFAYTFTTQADVSVPGMYTFDATVSLAGDVNPINDAPSQYVVQNTAASVGGTLSAPGSPSPSGVLSLSGQTGNVIEWQQSIDAARWRALENTTATQSFALLAEPTRFRALVQNGSCAAAYSSAVWVYPGDPVFSNGFEP